MKAANKKFKSNSPMLQTFFRTLLDKISDSEVFNPFLTLKTTASEFNMIIVYMTITPFQTSEPAVFTKQSTSK
jgi:hypothetical protein